MILVLLSGGVDSSAMLGMLVTTRGADNVRAVTFDYNQRNRTEIVKAKALCDRLGVHFSLYEMQDFGHAIKHKTSTVRDTTVQNPQCIIPHKNMVFAGLGLALAESWGCDEVAIGIIKNDSHVWDACKSYITKLNRCTFLKVITPLIDSEKKEVLRLLKAVGIQLSETTSCYNEGDCGNCGSCQATERARHGY